MDFVSARVANGRTLKCLTVVYDAAHEVMAVPVEHSMGQETPWFSSSQVPINSMNLIIASPLEFKVRNLGPSCVSATPVPILRTLSREH
jgi:hypothetical protein